MLQGPPGARVTVAVVSHSGRARIDRCLQSIERQGLGAAVHTVVVDNASRDGTGDHVAGAWPQVELIRSTVNLGYAGGNNLVLERVDTPFVLLLNDDAVLQDGALSALLEHVEAPASSCVAAATATVLFDARFDLNPRGDVVDSHGRRLSPSLQGPLELVNSTGNVVRADGYGVDRDWLSPIEDCCGDVDVFGFCGAAALLRVDALHEVGLFDPDFFMYYEDTDLSWRLRRAGWTVHHVSSAIVRHEHAASSREGSDFFHFHDDRNRLLTLVKNASPRLVLSAVGRYLLTTASVMLRRREPSARIVTRMRVLLSFGRLLPVMLRRRAAIDRSARVPRSAVDSLLAPVPSRPTQGYRTEVSR